MNKQKFEELHNLTITRVWDNGMDSGCHVEAKDSEGNVWRCYGYQPPWKPLKVIDSSLHRLDNH